MSGSELKTQQWDFILAFKETGEFPWYAQAAGLPKEFWHSEIIFTNIEKCLKDYHSDPQFSIGGEADALLERNIRFLVTKDRGVHTKKEKRDCLTEYSGWECYHYRDTDPKKSNVLRMYFFLESQSKFNVPYASDARFRWNFTIGRWCGSFGPKQNELNAHYKHLSRAMHSDCPEETGHYDSFFCSEMILSAIIWAQILDDSIVRDPCTTLPVELKDMAKTILFKPCIQRIHAKLESIQEISELK